MAVCEAGRRSLPDTESAGTLTLDSPGPRIVVNKCLLFIMQVNYIIQVNLLHPGVTARMDEDTQLLSLHHTASLEIAFIILATFIGLG